MACEITSGYAIECRESVGGVEAIWLIANSNLYFNGVSLVESTDGVVTQLDKLLGTHFFKFEVPRATSTTSNGITSSQENGTFFYTHSVKFPINQRNASVRNIITTLAKNRCTFVVKEGDGLYKLFGKEFGLTLDNSEGTSGTALADRNGYMLSFSSQEREDFLIVPENIALTLETAGTID